jgi:DNA-cytosine methyltransferase
MRLNGLDLFSGIGGISYALGQWVKPVIYCEIDPYAQKVLLSRMADESLPDGPIWDDIKTLQGLPFRRSIDIVYGGFPCQDISLAGSGKGLEGERSGLFFEIVRLAKEIEPRFIFLENVPAITSRGGLQVVREITEMGYDCRWCVISASSIGALHRRERWFLLAHTTSESSDGYTEREEEAYSMPTQCGIDGDTYSESSKQTYQITFTQSTERRTWGRSSGLYRPFESREHWQEVVSSMGKCSDGISDKLVGIDLVEGSMLIYKYASTNETSPREILSLLQGENLPSSFCEWETSGEANIPKKEILFEFLRLCVQECEQMSVGKEFLSQEGSKTSRGFLRSMRNSKKSTSSSHRPKLQKQRNKQFADTLQDLSQLLAQNFKSAWKKKCRKDAQDHVARLRALGNAVVPQQVRKAFEILMGIKKREDILSPLPIIFTDSR